MRFYLRATGISLLVSLVDTPPGDHSRYINPLKKLLRDWGAHWHKGFSGDPSPGGLDRCFNPAQLYCGCGFIGLGTWDIFTLTLVSEKGLATHLPFIGYVRGQSHFHAHDYSFVTDRTGLQEKELHVLDRLEEICDHFGITDLVRSPADDPKRYKLNSRSDLMACWRPLTLSHINSGLEPDDLWGAPTKNRDYWHQIQNEEFMNREDSLAGVYQFKLNQRLVTMLGISFSKFVYLVILSCFSNDLKRSDLPPVVRVLLCDGYFDLLLLMRSRSLPQMEHYVQRVKYLTVKKALACLEKSELRPLLGEELDGLLEGELAEPLMELTQSTIGFAYKKYLAFEKQTLLKRALGAFFEGRDESIQKNWPEIKSPFDVFNPDGKDNGETSGQKIIPSTLVSLNTGRLSWSNTQIDRLFKTLNIGATKVEASGETEVPYILYGSYDIELFKSKRPIGFGDFLAFLQLVKIMLLNPTRDHLFGESANSQSSGAVFRERMSSCLLSLYSQIGSPLEAPPDQEEPPLRMIPKNPRVMVLGTHRVETILKETARAVEAYAKKTSRRGGHWDAIHKSFEASKECWEDALASGDHEPQACFNRFLSRRFGGEVSSEVREFVFTTFCAVDGLLADPMRFHLFLDVGRYLENFFRNLLTLHPVPSSFESFLKSNTPPGLSTVPLTGTGSLRPISSEDPARIIKDVLEKGGGSDRKREGGEKVHFGFLDWRLPDKPRYRLCHAERKVFVGLEAHFLQFLDLIRQVVSQRAQGSFPFHDRSVSRLSDLRTFQTKKMVAVGWMVNKVTVAIKKDVTDHLEQVVRKMLPERKKTLNFDWLDDWDFPPSLFIARFSNAAEALVIPTALEIILNGRYLTSTESLVLLFHEIGHIFSRSLSDDPDHKDIDQKQAVPYEYAWDEVLADLFVFKLCYARYDHPMLNRLIYQKLKHIPRYEDRFIRELTSLQNDPEAYDPCDFFLLSMVMQWSMLPKIQSWTGFANLINRMILLLTLLKWMRYREQPELLQKQPEALFEIIYERAVQGFFDTKLAYFLDYLCCGKDEAAGLGHPHLLKGHWGLFTRKASSKNPIKSLLEGCKSYARSAFVKFHNKLDSDPRFQLALFLAAPWGHMAIDSPFFKDQITGLGLEGSPEPSERELINRLDELPDGVLEAMLTFKESETFFAAAAQLLGFANLFFCYRSRSPVVFSNGYAGFAFHRSQQHLSRLRQLIMEQILIGSSKEIHKHLEERGFSDEKQPESDKSLEGCGGNMLNFRQNIDKNMSKT